MSDGPFPGVVWQVLMTGGTTYLVVVSGFGTEAGSYQINITANNGQLVSGLPFKGRFALAQSSSITSASSNNIALGERPTTMSLTLKC